MCEVYAVISDVEPAAVERLSAAGPQRREMLALAGGIEPADGAHRWGIGCGLGKFTDAGIIDPDIGRKASEAVLCGAFILDGGASDV